MYSFHRALVTDKQEVACVLNKQFHSVFTSDTNKALPEQTPLTATDKQPTLDNAFSYHNVHRQLSTLNKHKSQGPDSIHSHVVKECADVFATILSLFFTKSYTESSIPAAWRDANISPIYKKGKRTEPSNYRPISLTSVLCKVMERIIRDEMVLHLTANKLITTEQHGFVQRRSCMTNLLESLDHITETLNRDFIALVVFLDFAKAFDKLSH